MNSDLVRSYLVGLQERICTAIEAEDGDVPSPGGSAPPALRDIGDE